jgi:hypothetical protein
MYLGWFLLWIYGFEKVAAQLSSRGKVLSYESLGTSTIQGLTVQIDRLTYTTYVTFPDPGIVRTATTLIFTPADIPSSFLAFYAHQTVGTVCSCAISRNGTNQDKIANVPNLVDLLALGITVIEPDYYGFDCPDIQPYLVLSAVANSIIDAIYAVRNWKSVYAPYIVGYGWSQGGHAVLALQQYMKFVPDLRVLVAAAIAPPTNLTALIDYNLKSLPGKYLSVLGIYSWPTFYPELNMTQLVNEKKVGTVSHIAQLCVLKPNPESNSEFVPLLKLWRNANWLRLTSPTQQPLWLRRMQENSASSLLTEGIQVLVFQGKKDSLVQWQVTQQWVSQTQQQPGNGGNAVQFFLKDDETHNSIKKFAMPIIIQHFISALQPYSK